MTGVRDELCGRAVGEFVLRERIGEGGNGAVYRCEQPLLGREAVIKVLHGRLRTRQVMIQRFLREARLASRLDHPYAAHVYAFGVEKADGLLWIAMEMVHGTPLDAWLRTRGPMPLTELVPFFERIAEVVQTGHERGIVHRDLKPSNVMVIERAGRLLPKLLDFGIAKFLLEEHPADGPQLPQAEARPGGDGDGHGDGHGNGHGNDLGHGTPVAQRVSHTLPAMSDTLMATPDEEDSVSLQAGLTATGVTIGSPPYMSPEQWRGEAVGPRADLYALGVLAYEALAGRRPFQAPSALALADLHMSAPVPPLGGDHPAALDRFFARALAKDPRDRPGSALELAAALRVAAGLAEAPVELPHLERAIHDTWVAEAPQPLAAAVAALEDARNPHQARDAAWDLFRTLVRYLLALALAARAQVREARSEPDADALLRELGRRTLDDPERVRLIRRLVRAFASRRGVYPIPPLVDLLVVKEGEVDPLEHVLRLEPALDSRRKGGDHVRSQLAQLVAALGRLLRATSFVLDYPLVVARSGVCERWMGFRHVQRPLAEVRGPAPAERQPVLLDPEGRCALALWPLAELAPPTPGAGDELFLFDGHDRRGARLLSVPHGFERHDPALWDWLGEHAFARTAAGAGAGPEARAPYRGLETFSAADADRFVGREREVDALTNRLRTATLQIVVGASGAGKSSFIHAGIVPALPRGSRVVTMRPGSRPLATLAARLGAAAVPAAQIRALLDAAPGTTPAAPASAAALGAVAALVAEAVDTGLFVLVVDQLEELFTLCRDEAERERFAALVDLLASAPDGRLRVICTLRDDFMMRAAALPVLGPRMATSVFFLGNPSREDLIRTIVEPARGVGYELSDPELAPEMADAVVGRPGALALLSFTASRLWELRDRRFHRLTRRAYEAMGGVGGALGQHAEETIAALGAEEHRLVREAFRHLVTAEGTRAQLSMAELGQVLASPNAGAVIDNLVAARLLVIAEHEDGARVEIIHEALLAAWPRVQAWIREDADSARMRDQVRAAARQWNERGRARGLLWRDEALAELEWWMRQREAHGLTATERAFADASRAAAARGRHVRQLALVTAFTVLGAALAVMYWLRGEATHQRALVQAQLVRSYVERGQQALLGGHVGAALTSLEEAHQMGARTPAVRFMLARARESREAELATLRGHVGRVRVVAFNADGTRVLTTGEDAAVRIWEPVTGRELHALQGHVPPVAAAWSPGGEIATADAAGTIRLWTADGRLRTSSGSERDSVARIAFRGDGAVLALAHASGNVSIRDARSGALRAAWAAGQGDLYWIEFDRSGTRVVTAGLSSTAVVWSIEGRALARLEGHTRAIWHAMFDRTDQRIITASLDSTAGVWEAGSGKPIHRLRGHEDRVTTIALDAAGQRIATASADTTVRIWSIETGDLLGTLRGHTGQVNALRFAPGDQLATAAADGTARVWDVAQGIQTALYHHGGFLGRLDLDPRAGRLATASWSGSAKIWDLRRQSRLGTFAHAVARGTTAPESAKAVLAAGRLARIGPHGIAVWEVASAALQTWEVPDIVDGALTPDGRTVIAADVRGFLHVLDASGDQRHQFHAHEQQIVSIAAHPDGRRVATCDAAGTIAVWELATGRKLAERRVGDVNRIGFSDQGTAMFAISRNVMSQGNPIGWLLSTDLSRAHRLEHGAGLSYAAFAPGGALLATLSMDGTARIWNHSGGLDATLRHNGPLYSAAWSPDGRWFAIGSNAGGVMIWERARWRVARTLDAHINYVSALTFVDAGTLLASAGGDGKVKIWDTESFLQLAEIPTRSSVDHLAITRDQLLVSGPLATQSWRCDLYGQVFEGQMSEVVQSHQE